MSRRSWLPLAVVLLVMACSTVGWAGDEVRDGAKFNRPASGITLYKTRTLTGVVDSAVTTYPAQVLPLPITVGGVVRSDTSSKALTPRLKVRHWSRCSRQRRWPRAVSR